MSSIAKTFSRDEIFVTVKTLLAEHFDLKEETIIMEARLYEDLDLDSIDAVDMIVELKRITGKSMEPESFKQVRTISDVVTAVSKMVND